MPYFVSSHVTREPDLPAFVVSRPLPRRYDEPAPKYASTSSISSLYYHCLLFQHTVGTKKTISCNLASDKFRAPSNN